MKIIGRWWFPESPQPCYGELAQENKGSILLELHGHEPFGMKDGQLNLGVDHVTAPIIHGISIDGNLITLVDCASAGLHMSFPGFAVSKFYVQEVFIGAHYDSAASVFYEKLSLSLPDLDQWVGQSGLEFSITMSQDEEKLHAIQFRYVPIDFQESESAGQMMVGIGCNAKTKYDLTKRSAIELDYRLNLESKVPLHYGQWLDEWCSPVWVFFSLAYGRATRGRIFGSVERSEIELVRGSRARVTQKLVDADEMLFRLRDLDSLGQALGQWFERCTVLRPVTNLYYTYRSTRRTPIEGQFLLLTQALEAYHRLTGKRKTQIQAELYQELREEVSRTITSFSARLGSESLQFFLGKLEYMNEVSLKSRLVELVDRAGYPVTQFYKKGDGKSFASKATAVRNFLTHSGDNKKPISPKDIFLSTLGLQLLLEACLLQEIGLAQEHIFDCLHRGMAGRILRRQLRTKTM